MPETATKSDLHRSAVDCLDGLRNVVALLNVDRPEETGLGSLWAAWERYYFGEFARFDALVQIDAAGAGRDYARYLAVSINHHNLHRLIEVLRSDIGDRPLGATRVPERTVDLFEVCSRLVKLLENTCAADVSSGPYSTPRLVPNRGGQHAEPT